MGETNVGTGAGFGTENQTPRTIVDAGSRSLRSRVVRGAALVLTIGVLAGSFAGVSQAEEEYDSARAGNPLRLAAYVLHPVGVILDYVIFRPTYWLFSHEPLRTLVGQDD